jgi:hypothetical protein
MMSAHRTVHLLIYPGQPNQRAHFDIWIADVEGGDVGTVTHVVGSPMAGFMLQFKRKYDPSTTGRKTILVSLGEIDTQHLDISENYRGIDTTPKGDLERVASQIQPPRPSQNFLAPVNDVCTLYALEGIYLLVQTTNRRCQEWTLDFVRRLVAVGYLDESAIEIVQSRRDAPDVGIGLRPVRRA